MMNNSPTIHTSYSPLIWLNLSSCNLKMIWKVTKLNPLDFGWENKLETCAIVHHIMYVVQLHYLHDETLLVLDQFVHLLPEDDVNGNYKCFHWVCLGKIGLIRVYLIVWATPPPTWCTPLCPLSTCPPAPWWWFRGFLKILPLDSAQKNMLLTCVICNICLWLKGVHEISSYLPIASIVLRIS